MLEPNILFLTSATILKCWLCCNASMQNFSFMHGLQLRGTWCPWGFSLAPFLGIPCHLKSKTRSLLSSECTTTKVKPNWNSPNSDVRWLQSQPSKTTSDTRARPTLSKYRERIIMQWSICWQKLSTLIPNESSNLLHLLFARLLHPSSCRPYTASVPLKPITMWLPLKDYGLNCFCAGSGVVQSILSVDGY
jgi:hypothetical protein